MFLHIGVYQRMEIVSAMPTIRLKLKDLKLLRQKHLLSKLSHLPVKEAETEAKPAAKKSAVTLSKKPSTSKK